MCSGVVVRYTRSADSSARACPAVGCCRYPNNTVVHMHCAQDSMDFDPVTGTKFSKRQQI